MSKFFKGKIALFILLVSSFQKNSITLGKTNETYNLLLDSYYLNNNFLINKKDNMLNKDISDNFEKNDTDQMFIKNFSKNNTDVKKVNKKQDLLVNITCNNKNPEKLDNKIVDKSKNNSNQTFENYVNWFKNLSFPQKLAIITLAGFAGYGVSSAVAHIIDFLSFDRLKKGKFEYKSKFIIETPKKNLDKLVVSEKTKQSITQLLTKIKYNDVLCNEFGLAESNNQIKKTLINFYGPPGTGKSFAAEAVANELGKKIIRVSYADLESIIVGQTAKNIRTIFEFANKKDTVLIFDEADAILSKRLTNISRANDYEVNMNKSVLLTEMDKFSGIIIFTTNFGENYDSAFVRRIIGHVKFDLPDAETRKKLFESFMTDKLPISISDKEKNTIIRETEGFSGGDLSNVIMHAALSALTRDGEKCKLNLNDFKNAIDTVKASKNEVGIVKNIKK